MGGCMKTNRNLSSCPKDVKAKCYKSIICPQLEYTWTVQDPITKSDIAKLESVQRPATRFRCSDYRQTSSVTSMLQELGWEDLQSRRDQNKATMMYRVTNNLVEIPTDLYLITTCVATKGHIINDSCQYMYIVL